MSGDGSYGYGYRPSPLALAWLAAGGLLAGAVVAPLLGWAP